MKRIAIAVVATFALLAAAGTAFAAVNTYKASYKFSGSKKGHISFNQTITVTPATPGSRAGLLHQINTTIEGVKVDTSGVPTCTAATINAKGTDAGCPKKAMVATGSIDAVLGSSTNFQAAGAACDPELHVWNAGKGKLVFFFVETQTHQCLGGALHTGQVPPWMASYRQAGRTLDVSIPIPNTVDYPLGLTGNEVGSLQSESLHWISQKNKGKYDILSTGCSGSKRSYTFSFNASLPGQAAETKSLSAKAPCA